MRISQVILSPAQTLRQILEALASRLDFKENFRCKIITIADTGSANSDNVVDHNLGVIPTGYIWNISAAGVVYDHNRAGWNATSMTIRCSISNASVVLVIF